MFALEAKALSKTFHTEGKRIDVLKAVSLQIPEGAFHAVMGPSGSGKSTLLNLLAGLLPADSGEVWVDGRALTGLSDHDMTLLRRRTVGIIFQDFNLIPTLTVSENIALPALLDGHPLPQARLEKLLHLVGLSNRADQPAEKLSGGEAQRTAIARAFAMEPRIILADEPTGNLDSPSANTFCATLTRLNKELGTAILLISHDAQVAAAAETVHVLKDGVIRGSFASEHNATAVAARYLELMA
jgi:putative ABC transport system ATP-binding protein